MMELAGSKTFDLRRLPQLRTGSAGQTKRAAPDRQPPSRVTKGATPAAPIGSGTVAASAPAPAPSVDFDGLRFSDACTGGQCGQGHPPDPNGDVGPAYFIEAINVAIGVFDKSTGGLVAAVTFNSFMSQGAFGNLCDTDNEGDPVVLYDSFHDRWVITDFALQLDGSGNVLDPPGSYQCFAVSQSGDPVSGGWNFYSLHLTDGLQDYPKFGIWPDGLYMSANMFDFSASGGFQNVRVWALNLEQMEAGGGTVQVVSFNASSRTGPCEVFTLLPSNARLQTGSPPPGTPNYFASVWCYTGRVRIWAFHVDWGNTAASTFTGPTDSSTGSNWGAPPGTVPSLGGNLLDTLPVRLMMQNQYTNLGGVESLWESHTVEGASSSQAAVRWYQVPVTGGAVGSAVQAATWNPDGQNRFLPSLAVDHSGNMAIAYSVASSSLYPSIRYAGRMAGDPAGTLPQTETSLIEGTGSQSGSCGGSPCERWGDYSVMTLDPSDGCTFWYVNEYYATTGLDYHTRIGAFSYPSCAGSPVPTPTPTPSPMPSFGSTVHVGNLDALARRTGLTSWRATVTVLVQDSDGLPVAFATVDATWAGGYSGTGTCTTDATGLCQASTATVPNTKSAVTFTIATIVDSALSYDSSQNTDPDGDSDGTTITISRPY